VKTLKTELAIGLFAVVVASVASTACEESPTQPSIPSINEGIDDSILVNTTPQACLVPVAGTYVSVCNNSVANECGEYVFGARSVWNSFVDRCEADGGVVQVTGTISASDSPVDSWDRHPCRRRAGGGFCVVDRVSTGVLFLSVL